MPVGTAILSPSSSVGCRQTKALAVPFVYRDNCESNRLPKAMKTLSLTTQHCLSLAAIWLQAASVLSSRFMVKYGPNTVSEDRTQEVRG